MDTPSVVHTLATGYPTREPELYTRCTYCSEELFNGEEIVRAHGFVYCDEICFAKLALDEGTIEKVVAGE